MEGVSKFVNTKWQECCLSKIGCLIAASCVIVAVIEVSSDFIDESVESEMLDLSKTMKLI